MDTVDQGRIRRRYARGFEGEPSSVQRPLHGRGSRRSSNLLPSVSSKSKERSGPQPGIGLIKTPDILKELHNSGLGKGRLIVSFALESENGRENALKKLSGKGLDYIALNMIDIRKHTTPIGRDDNELEPFPLLPPGVRSLKEAKRTPRSGWL